MLMHSLYESIIVLISILFFLSSTDLSTHEFKVDFFLSSQKNK